MENKVREFIKALGISPEMTGFKYIVASVIYIKKIGDPSDVSFTKLYKVIGDDFNTTSAAVERCIRQAIYSTFESPRCLDNIRKLLKFPFPDGTTTNSKFLALCADVLDSEV